MFWHARTPRSRPPNGDQGSSVSPPPNETARGADSERQSKARARATVLVQLRDTIDRETGQRFTVKRYASEKAQADDAWRHTRTLSPVNPDFAPIVLTPDNEGDLEVIAELVEVLQGDP